jgi:hypothetical protein
MNNLAPRIAVKAQNPLEGVICVGPAISALKKKYPDTQVGLTGDESYREASLLVTDADFFVLETDLGETDQVLDLSLKGCSSATFENTDWLSYSLGVDGFQCGNPYHRIDIARKIAGVDTVDANFELLPPSPSDQLPESLLSPNGLRIAVCAASLTSADIESILEAFSRLSVPTEIFIVGTVKDRRVVNALAPAWDGKLAIHDLCGRISLTGSAFVARNVDICISGPGLSTLLSSGYGTFTICVDRNPARGPLAFPYGHGHLVIQPATGVEFDTVFGNLLQGIIEYAISANGGMVPSLDQWQAFADSSIENFLGKVRLLATQRVEILLSENENSAEQSFTELYLRPLLFLGSESFDVLQTFYRLLWEHTLNSRSITTFDLQVLHQNAVPAICELLKPLEQMYELANFGRTYSGYVKSSLESGDIAKAKQDSARLQEVEELVHGLAGAHPALSPLAIYHHYRQQQLDTENPIELASRMTGVFSQLQGQVLALLDLAQTLFHTTFQKESALAASSLEEGLSDG